MNIFSILYCYPPLQVPATMCYLKILAGLREAGFGITVLTRDPASFDERLNALTDHTLTRLIPEGVENRRVKTRESNSLLRKIRSSTLGRKLLYRFLEPGGREFYRASLGLLGREDFREFDVILSCSQPHINHLVGCALKKKTGKPWIACFSDPWVDNPYTHYASEGIRGYHAALEEEVVKHADRIFFTSGEMSALVMRKYPPGYAGKCGVLPHSFIPGWYGLGKSEGPAWKKGKIRVLHTGHFYGPRTPFPFLDAVAGLHEETDLTERIEIRFYGKMGKPAHDFIREKGLGGFFEARDTVPYLDSLAAMADADYLLLIDAPLRDSAESVFLPSKLIDYMGSHRPVLGITPAKGASARVLGESGNLACDIEDTRGIYRALKEMFSRSLRIMPDRDAISKYHYASVTKTLTAAIGGLA